MGIAWKRTVGPTVEPVSLDEAKAHLRVDVNADDLLLERLITAAREYVEEATGRALINQTWQLSLDAWPGEDYIELPRAPLSSITSVVYTDSNNTSNTFSDNNYVADTDSEPGSIVLKYGCEWPTVTLANGQPIKITYVSGYGTTSDSVPQQLRQAILLLVGHWYENREASVVGQGYSQGTLPFALQSVIALNRVNFWR